jgi:hypothetical protein
MCPGLFLFIDTIECRTQRGVIVVRSTPILLYRIDYQFSSDIHHRGSTELEPASYSRTRTLTLLPLLDGDVRPCALVRHVVITTNGRTRILQNHLLVRSLTSLLPPTLSRNTHKIRDCCARVQFR